jgi:hypothetical protein
MPGKRHLYIVLITLYDMNAQTEAAQLINPSLSFSKTETSSIRNSVCMQPSKLYIILHQLDHG